MQLRRAEPCALSGDSGIRSDVAAAFGERATFEEIRPAALLLLPPRIEHTTRDIHTYGYTSGDTREENERKTRRIGRIAAAADWGDRPTN